MNKTLRFTLVSLLMMLCGTAFAGSITFGGLNLENGVQYSDPFDGGDFTVTFAGGGNDGKYYTTGTGIRVYGGGTMTVAAKSGNITSITVTYDGSNKPSDGDVVNVGTYNAETGEWTGEAASVVFTRPSGSGHWRVKAVTVTVNGEGGDPQPQTDVYTIAGTGNLTGTAEAWTIDDANKMTKNNEGLYVKTFNGITISANNQPQFKVVKNAGKEGETWYPEGDGSSNWVITPSYLGGDGIYNITITFNAETNEIGVSGVKISWNTIAELNALQNNTTFTFFGEPLVVAKPTAKYVYIKDETGASLIYDVSGEKTAAAEAGKTIAAPWTGKVSIYKKLFELVPDAALTVKDGDAVEVTYDEATATDVTEENVNKVVIIKGLTISEINEKNITFAIGEATIAGYNQFGIELPEVTEGKTFDVVGAIGRYNDNIQFQPITITEAAAPVAELDYYLAGTMTEWKANEDYKLALNEAAEGVVEYMITVDLPADAQFKVAKSDGETIAEDAWYPAGMENNYIIKNAGNYTIYFRPNGDGGEDWHYSCIYAKENIPAQTATFNFADPNFRENIGEAMTDTKGYIYNETFTADGVSLQITAGSAPARIYVDNNRGQNLVTYKEYTTLTFKAPEGKAITKIEFTAAGNSNINNFTASSGAIDGMVWTGNAAGVRFNQGGTSYLANAIVTLEAATEATAALPAIEYTECENIAAFNALEAGTYAKLTLTNAEVIGKSYDGYTTVWIQDATGGAWIQYTSLNDRLQESTKVNGTIYAIKRATSGNPQLKEAEDTPKSDFSVETIDAFTMVEGTIEEVNIAANLNKVVKISGATLTMTSATAGTLKVGESTITVNNGNTNSGNQQLCKIADWEKDKVLEDVTIVAILVATSATDATKNQLLPISIYGGTVGISTLKNNAQNTVIFNINGQKVNKAQKGIYIINGKKTVIR
jgi:hypothetical protein